MKSGYQRFRPVRIGLAIMAVLSVLEMGQQQSCGQLMPGYSSPPTVIGSTAPPELAQSDWQQNRSVSYPMQMDWSGAVTQGYPETVSSNGWFNSQCDTCSVDGSGCQQFWEHRTRLFGDFLYLTVRDSRIPYATHIDGPVPGAAPLASTSVVDPEYQSGFRVGGAYALDPWTSISATYWAFRSEVTDSLDLPGNIGWARSEVTHPTTLSVANDSLFARAEDETSFQIGDLA